MTHDNEMMMGMLHLLPDKNKILLDSDVLSTKAHTSEYKIDNRSVYDILDQIYKNTDLYPYVKQQSRQGMVEGHIMSSSPGGWAQIMSMQQHQEL